MPYFIMEKSVAFNMYRHHNQIDPLFFEKNKLLFATNHKKLQQRHLLATKLGQMHTNGKLSSKSNSIPLINRQRIKSKGTHAA